MIDICIIGATGYVGIEIIRILQNHPYINISSIVSQNFIGKKISDVYPTLRGICDIECEDLNVDKLLTKADIFVTAIPHGISKDIIPILIQNNKRVIDHSGDFRFKKAEIYEKWYNTKHEMPHLLSEAVYGLTELYREEIKKAKLVANPGCYPTCSILGLAPTIKNNLIDNRNIIIDACSGVSGAGRNTELPYQFCECTENVKAYKVASHRHTPEIEQELGIIAKENITITFTPHLVPMKRGMFCTMYANLTQRINSHDLIQLYKDFYSNERFVRVLNEGVLPETKNVAGSNFIDISIVIDERTGKIIVLSAIDNMGKGAAGQSVQNINVMCGFDEGQNLKSPGLYL